MTRPIIWAAGTFVAIAAGATLAGDRLARLPSREQPAARAEGPRVMGLEGRTVSVPGDRRGHFMVDTAVDGRRLTMLVDTGASIVALTSEDAARAGIRPYPREYNRRVSTANGEVAVAPVRIREMRVGEITVRDVDAVVMPPGRLGTSLLGMSFLRQLRSFGIADGRLTLRG